jgi:hypothetical protein
MALHKSLQSPSCFYNLEKSLFEMKIVFAGFYKLAHDLNITPTEIRYVECFVEHFNKLKNTYVAASAEYKLPLKLNEMAKHLINLGQLMENRLVLNIAQMTLLNTIIHNEKLNILEVIPCSHHFHIYTKKIPIQIENQGGSQTISDRLIDTTLLRIQASGSFYLVENCNKKTTTPVSVTALLKLNASLFSRSFPEPLQRAIRQESIKSESTTTSYLSKSR